MDIVLASLISIASAGGLIHLGQIAYKEIRHYHDIEKAQTYSPGLLLREFNNKNLLLRSEKSEQNPAEYKLKGFVEGIVQCDAPVKSQINKSANLIHSIYYREDAFPSNISAKRDLSEPASNEDMDVRAPLLFKLNDPYTRESCLVHRSLEVNANHALEQIGEFTVYEELDVLDKILYYIGRFTQRFSSASRSSATVRGIKIGWTEKEFGIKVGSTLTVFGDIIYNSRDKSIRIDSPLYYLFEKSSILKELKRRAFGLKGKVLLLSVVFAISSMYMVKGLMAFYKRYKAKKLVEEADKLKLIKTLTLEKDYRCIKCLERPRSVILKPCLHFALCRTCYHEMHAQSCPVCKKTVDEAVEVFFT